MADVRSYNGVDISDSVELNASFIDILDKYKNVEDDFLSFYSGSRCLARYNFKEFVEEVEKLAAEINLFCSIGLRERVVVKANNTDSAIVAFSAILKSKAVIVPVSPDISEHDLQLICKSSNAKLIISDSKLEGDALELINNNLFLKILGHSPSRAQAVCDLDLNEVPSLQVFTSGTTGDAKSVVLTYKNLVANALAVSKHHGLGSGAIIMSVLPLYHVNAFNLSFFASLFSGSRLVLNRSFYLPAFWKIAENEKVSFISLVPKLIKILLEDRREIAPPTTIKYVTSAAAPLPIENARSFYSKFGIKVIQGYGMSEAVNFSLTTPIDLTSAEYEELLLLPDLTAGVELLGNHVVVKNKDFKTAQEGEIGELCLKGWSLMKGYENNPKANLKSFKDGFFKTGDLAYYKVVNHRKYYFLKGRSKELVIRNGENINPLSFETQIRKIPLLKDAVIVGFDNDYLGEGIGMILPIDLNNKTRSFILDEINTELGRRYLPDAIEFSDNVFYTVTGKLQRNKMRVLFSEYQSAAIN